TLEILRGDVLVDGKVCRKTPSAQKSLWLPVYDINYVWKEGSAWDLPRADARGTPADGTWSLDGKRLVATCPSGELSWVRYAGRIGDAPDDRGVIRDTCAYDHDLNVIVNDVVRTGAGRNVVADVRIAFDLTVSGNGRIELALPFADDKTDTDDRAVLDLAAGKALITRSGRELGSTVLPALADGRKHHVTFQRLDYLLVLAIDGEKTLECDVWDLAAYRGWVEDAALEQLGGWRRSGVALGASDVKLVLTDLRIDRDVYYTYREQGGQPGYYHAWRIPEGCCFAMGDNSPESYDSRYWKDNGGETFVPLDHLIGRGLVIWWHPMRVRLIR
ncbi:MAG TPA: S26 family signal peptidase, partial [Planctomycetota bacterium]|nr:S26 family signal peptidase [Planctomycetota bacterium]